MLPHPSTIHAVTELRRRDLLTTAEPERRAGSCARASIAVLSPNAWSLMASAAAVLVLIGLAVAPGTLSTHARAAPTVAHSPEEATNLEVARRFFEVLHDTGDLTVAQAIVLPEAVFHIPGGELIGPEGIGGLVTLLRTAFPDAVFPMDDVVVEGDTVAVRWVMRGTSQGEFQGIPPTGESVELRGTAFLRIQDGRIAEDWVTYDQLGLLQQLGAAPEADTDRTCVARSKAESSCQ